MYVDPQAFQETCKCIGYGNKFREAMALLDIGEFPIAGINLCRTLTKRDKVVAYEAATLKGT